MRKSNFTESQRLAILAEQDSGQSVEDICRKHQISPATFYKWKKEVAVEQDEGQRRLKELEKENARLKKLVAALDEIPRGLTGRVEQLERAIERGKARRTRS